MDSMSLLALVGVVSAGGGVAVGMIIKGVTSTKHIELAKKMGALEADANDGEKIKEAMETYKASTVIIPVKPATDSGGCLPPFCS